MTNAAKLAGKLEKRIGYTFADRSHLLLALTHSSYANEYRLRRIGHNERIEFLGDAVLEIIASDFLYRNFPEMSEGQMSRKRASLVCEPTLAYCARQIGLGEFLFLGKGEDMSGGRGRDSILSDALEALIGAIYLDGGMEEAKTFIMKYILDDIEHKSMFRDSKTYLQEILQKDGGDAPTYEITGQSGPPHAPVFRATVYRYEKALAEGEGKTKKQAEQAAALAALQQIQNSEFRIQN